MFMKKPLTLPIAVSRLSERHNICVDYQATYRKALRGELAIPRGSNGRFEVREDALDALAVQLGLPKAAA
jgi:hypothetical protein